MVSQKENESFLATEPEDKGYCDLTDKELKKKLLRRNSLSYKKTQKGNIMISGIKLMNRRSALPKRLKF